MFLLFAIACGAHQLPTQTIDVGGHSVTAEIADDAETRARGLMYRESMSADDGMLFVYPDETPRSFWMKDTTLPLSIAFADRQGVIVKIADMKPLDTSRVQSLYPAMYALEMNRGWFDAHGVAAGAKLGDLPKGH